MSSVLDNSVVGLMLLVSAAYAVLSMGPRSLRNRLLSLLSRATAAAPRFLGLRRVSQRLAAASAVKPSGACGGCDNCGTEESSAQVSSSPDINIPVANIRKVDRTMRG
jgi:hypothetical protein